MLISSRDLEEDHAQAKTILIAAVLGVAIGLGCGSRTELSSLESDGALGAGDGAEPCAVGPSCPDHTRGTYRLTAPDGTLLGRLFFFDGSNACGGSATQYLLTLEIFENDRRCSRFADIEVVTDTPDTFIARATNHGGSFGPLCGGEPGGEEIEIELQRLPCQDDQYEVFIRNSELDSPYTLAATASQCRCDIGWAPCVDPLPDDPCAPALP